MIIAEPPVAWNLTSRRSRMVPECLQRPNCRDRHGPRWPEVCCKARLAPHRFELSSLAKSGERRQHRRCKRSSLPHRPGKRSQQLPSAANRAVFVRSRRTRRTAGLSAASIARGRSSHRTGSKNWDDITLPASRIWDRRKSFYRRMT